jgi:hypothetical protein
MQRAVAGRLARAHSGRRRIVTVAELQRSQEKAWSLIVARAWADADFKARLMAHPEAVLAEHGFDVDPAVELRMVEDTDRLQHFVLPASPGGDLSEEELSPVAGTDSFSGICGRCGRCGCGCGCGCRGCDAF